MTRYTRQTCLPEVGTAGQDAIRAARVLVVGAGGLGASALQYLVGAGVGHVTLVDGDTVDLSNLHRQTLFREADVGKPKAEVAAQSLCGLNGECEITAVTNPLTPANAADLVADSTIVLDCADSFAVSYILSDTCLAKNVPLISASVLGFAGYVGGFCGGAPSLRAIFSDLPDRAATCATAGVLGPAVGMLGAAQAQMALGCLIGQTPSPLGQMLNIDMLNFRTSGFRFDGAPEPDVDFRFISASDIADTDFVVDLRGADETPAPLGPHINITEFTQTRLLPQQGQRAVFVCKSGLRAWRGACHLRSYWDGEISVIAMGDMPEIERQFI